MTKNERIAKDHYTQFLNCNNYSLYDIYKTPSRWKHIAFESLKRTAETLNAISPVKILNGTCHAFTAGFEFVDGETGEVKFAYVTKDHFRTCNV